MTVDPLSQLHKRKAMSKIEQNLLIPQENDEKDHPDLESPKPLDLLVPKPRRFHRFKTSVRSSVLAWILTIISLVIVSITVWLAWRIANVQSYFNTFTNYTADLKLLRILVEVNTVLLTTLTAMTSRVAIWAASSSRRGVSMSTWLAMSPATGILGLVKLFWWRQQKDQAIHDWHRVCSLIRFFLFHFGTYLRILIHIAIPVVSVLLTSEFRSLYVSNWSFHYRNFLLAFRLLLRHRWRWTFQLHLCSHKHHAVIPLLQPVIRDISQLWGSKSFDLSSFPNATIEPEYNQDIVWSSVNRDHSFCIERIY
jgi:hypothetical protein